MAETIRTTAMNEAELDAMLNAVSWEEANGTKVRQFIQGYLKKVVADKVGVHQLTNENHNITIRSFANDEARQRWEGASDEERVSNPEISSLVLGMMQFKEASDTEGYIFSPKLKGSPAGTVVRGESCVFRFTYDCYYAADNTPDTEKGRVEVRVNGEVITALTQELIPDKTKEVAIDFGKYLTSESNSVKVIISNKYGQSRTFTYTIKTVNVRLALEGFDEAAIKAEGPWTLRVRNQGNAAKVYVKVDDLAPIVQSIGSGTMMDFAMPIVGAGAHSLKVWGEIEEFNIASEPIAMSFIRVGSTPAICVGSAATKSVAHYGNIVVPFFFYHPFGGNPKVVKYLIADSSGNEIKGEQTVNVDCVNGASGMQVLNISTLDSVFDGYDAIKVVLSISHNGTEYSAECDIALTEAEVTLRQAPQHEIYFTAAGHNNSDTDRNNWLNLGEGVNCEFRLSDDFRLTKTNGFKDGAFIIPRGKTLTLGGYKPFLRDVGANNAGGGSGKTVEFEFMVKNCTNANTSVIRCMDGNVGFQIFANGAEISSTNSRIATQFAEEVRLRVGFCIEGATRECVNKIPNKDPQISYKNIEYLYVNGIPVRLDDYQGAKWNQANPQEIEIGSRDCDIELYTVRIYNRALDFREMISNFAYDTPNLEEKIAIAKRNDIFSAEGEIDFAKVRAALPNTPYKIWDFEEMPADKKNWKSCSTSFVNPWWVDDMGEVCASFECVGHTFALDGTSSLNYPDPYKNWADKYKGAQSWKVLIGNTYIDITGYSITPGVIGVFAEFVDKVNFASSEGIFNILAANLFHDIILATSATHRDLLTPMQEEQYLGADGESESVKNVTYRQSLSGFPEIGYRKRKQTDGSAVNEFLSIYNFINNKYDPTIFGLDAKGKTKDGKQVKIFEVEDNFNIFSQYLEDGKFVDTSDGKRVWEDKATSLYYARVPKASPANKDADFGKPLDESASEVARAIEETAILRRFHNWIYSINPHVANRYKMKYGAYQQLSHSVTYGSKTFTHDTPEYRKQKFLAEYGDYFIKSSALFYFLFFDFLIGVDSFEKNMSLAFLPIKQADGSVKWLAMFFPRDSDTLAMYINTGLKELMAYHEWGDSFNRVTGETGKVEGEVMTESGNFTVKCSTGTPVYNGRLSGLWDMVADAWKIDLANMYAEMKSKGLNFATIWAKAVSFWEQWCEGLYCADGMGYVNTGRLDMAHGDKKEVLRYFLQARQRYMDSKYAMRTTPVELRLWGNSPGIALRYSQPIYASVNFGAGAVETSRNIVPGSPSYFDASRFQFNESTVTIYDADLLTEISTYALDASGNKVERGLHGSFDDIFVGDLSLCKKLKRLELDFSGKADGSAKLGNNVCKVGESIALEECIVRNAPGVTGEIKFKSECLRSVDLRDTAIPSVSIPSSTSLTSVKLGANVQALVLEDFPNLETVTLQGYNKLKTVKIKNCQKLEASGLTYKLISAILNSSASLDEIELRVNWKNVTTATLRKLLTIPNVKVTGTIKMKEDDTGAITNADKMAIVAKFGDVDRANPATGLALTYVPIVATSAAFSGLYRFGTVGEYQLNVAPSPTSFNTLVGVQWSIEENEYATLTSLGVLRVAKVGKASAAPKATATCRIRQYAIVDGVIDTANTTEITVTQELHFYEREPQVGDLVFANGMINDKPIGGMTVVAKVFYVNPADKRQRLMASLNNLEASTWGLYGRLTSASTPPRTSDGSYVDITPLRSAPDGFDPYQVFPGGCSEPGGPAFSFVRNDSDGNPIPIGRYAEAGQPVPFGYWFTQHIIMHRNIILKDPTMKSATNGFALTIPPERGGGDASAYDALMTAISQCVQLMSTGSSIMQKYSQFYFPAASMCYAYEPTGLKEGEELAEFLKAGNWHLPSATEMRELYRVSQSGAIRGDSFGDISGYYWSSSEYSAGTAWAVNSPTNQIHHLKYFSCPVRPVLAF